MLMLAAGMEAPVGSDMVPTIKPVSTWPNNLTPATSNKAGRIFLNGTTWPLPPCKSYARSSRKDR